MQLLLKAGNWLADLPPATKIPAILVILVAVALVYRYLCGPPSPAIDRLEAELPESSAGKWAKFFRRQPLALRALITGLCALVGLLAVVIIFAPDTRLVSALLRRGISVSVPAHLFVRSNENYSYLYLKSPATRRGVAVDDNLTFKNISSETLFFFRISVQAYVGKDPNRFHETYSIDNGTDYIALGVFDVGSLDREEEYVVKLPSIYEWFQAKTKMDSEAFEGLMFPSIGTSMSCDLGPLPSSRPHQAFTTNRTLLESVNKFIPNANGRPLDRICGLPLKLIVDYRLGTDQYRLLFMGGTFYYGRADGDRVIPFPFAVAEFVKPRWSLWRKTSGADPQVINMDLEVSGSYSGLTNDPDLRGLYFVSRDEAVKQLDEYLTIHVDDGFERDLAAEANEAIRARDFAGALEAADRLINLQPGNTAAITAREEVRRLMME